jgi:hypothetical protein
MTNPLLAEEHYQFMPFDQAATPGEGHFEHYVSHWWVVHPEKGLVFYNPVNSQGRRRRRWGSPHCNRNEDLARLVHRKTITWEGTEVRLIESAWVPLDISDYDH